MSWFSAVPLVLLAATWMTLPGLLVGVAAGLRGITVWGAAPLLSVGLIAGSAVAGSLLGVPWSGAVPVAAALLFAREGARVLCADLDPAVGATAARIRDAGGTAVAETADLDPAFAEKFLAFVVEEVIRHHRAIAAGETPERG